MQVSRKGVTQDYGEALRLYRVATLELTPGLTHPYDDTGVPVLDELVNNPLLLPLIMSSLHTPTPEVDTLSVVTSLADAPTQHWHHDVNPQHARVRAVDTPPPFAVVVGVPLVDMGVRVGPTEFVVGSHWDCPLHESAARKVTSPVILPGRVDDASVEVCPTAGRVVHAASRAGSAVVFDIRVLHRGGANTTGRKRPLLYTSFFRGSHVDEVNWRTHQSASFADLPPQLQPVSARVDGRKYVRDLEQAVVALGGDLASVRGPTFSRRSSRDDK